MKRNIQLPPGVFFGGTVEPGTFHVVTSPRPDGGTAVPPQEPRPTPTPTTTSEQPPAVPKGIFGHGGLP